MMAEGINRNSTHFRIFTSQIVLRDVGLNLIAHGLVYRHLSSDRGATCSFGTATSFEQRPAIVRRNATQLGRTLALR
jgi:hypothetical protein